MLHKGLNLIAGLSEYGGRQAAKHFLPVFGNLVAKGVDKANQWGFKSPIIHDTANALFNEIHGIVNDINKGKAIQYIGPSPNAAYGVGTLGPKELSPAFVGDRQETYEDFEKIAHNPIPKYSNRKKKAVQKKEQIKKAEKKKLEQIRKNKSKYKGKSSKKSKPKKFKVVI